MVFRKIANMKWPKLVLSLIFILFFLQLIHLLMVNRLKNHQSRRNSIITKTAVQNYSQYSEQIGFRFKVDVNRAVATLMGRTVLDGSGRFAITRYLFKPTRYPNIDNPRKASLYRKDVTLVTHGSLENVRFLSDLVLRWKGLISVAVFIPDISTIKHAIEAIATIRFCHPLINQFVAFHFVHPFLMDTNMFILNQFSHQPDCFTFRNGHNNSNLNHNATKGVISYPNNILLNVAKMSIPTEFVLVLDINFLPSQNLKFLFLKFAFTQKLFDTEKSTDGTVYVLPAFQVNKITDAPRYKEELLKQWKSSINVRPYYSRMCLNCQINNYYKAWENMKGSKFSFTIAFEVQWEESWEPFYIGRQNVPSFEERFQQYGFNRISQVCEMYVAGYRFMVINEAFVVHRGFQTVDPPHGSKQSDQDHNRLLYRLFKDELKVRYPSSNRRCD